MLNIGEFARLGQISPRMLRHYDEIGLLIPDRVDLQTGYRSYDLGFTLEQVRLRYDLK